ncbi:MAG: SoxR reducing system RseC family protein [Deltaproteobacteria bacterium]|nr:SoxR reducing system RseC family protein [Deltaproteobacteria bacterium]
MVGEEGIVLRRDGTSAWVRVMRSKACQGCRQSDCCGASLLEQDRFIEILADNAAGAEEGERVSLECSPAVIAKTSLLLYFLPIFVMVLAALAGFDIGTRTSLDPVLVSALSGFSGLAVALLAARTLGKRIVLKGDFRPRIQSIKDASSHRNPWDSNPENPSM